MRKLLLLSFGIILLISLTSANGLVVTQYNFNVNKTYGQDSIINITIQNTEPYNFTKINFESNPYVSMNEIPVLSSDENITVPVKILSNSDASISLRIKGFYYSQIGESHQVYSSDILYPNNPTVCSKVLYKGDKIIFHNLNPFEVSIEKVSSLEIIKTLAANETFTWSLDTPTTVVYNVVRAGFPFTDPCTVTILNTTGIINNPDLDALIHFNIKNVYEKTTISATFPQTSYNLSLLTPQEGFINIKNSGDKIAKSIKIEGDWFNFNENNFDLSPGQSKNIPFTINALGKISNTNETGKTYTKQVKITGNFDTISKNFTIFLEYSQVSMGLVNNTSDFLEWIKEHYPELLKPKVIIQYVSNDTREVNITTTQEKLNGLATAIFDTQDYSRETFKRMSEAVDNLNSTIYNYSLENQKTSKDIGDLKTKINMGNNTSITIFLVILFVIVLVLGGFLLKFAHQRSKLKTYERLDANARD